MLSHARVSYKALGFLGAAAVGVDVDSFGRGGTSKLKRRKILVGMRAGKHITSLKGHKFNKMYCSDQKVYFDSEDPSMLLVPCLPFDKVMDWAIKGVADSLKDSDVLESFTEKQLKNVKNISFLRWSKLVEEIKINKRSRCGVPTEISRDGPVHAGKVRMTLGNSLPDPWLLLVKSAINYSAFRKAKLMPSLQGAEDAACDKDAESPAERASFFEDSLRRVGLKS